MKIYLQSLGCPKNTVDSEILMGELRGNGISFISDAEKADCIIINTCAFLLSAREEAIETILEAIKLKQKGLCRLIIVVGCLPQKYKRELEKELPEVDHFFEQLDFMEIGRLLRDRFELPEKKDASRFLLTPKHYAYLKIAEGCDNRCSYCTIPSIKGRYASRESDQILREAQQLVDHGVRELILIAQDTTSYGKDLNGVSLTELMRKITTIEELVWLRLLYAHPAHFDRDIIQLIKNSDKVCKYIDLPIQHVSDKILKSMNRKIKSHELRRLLDEIRSEIPDIVIRTSVIVGYPGETDSEYNELVNFIKDISFERLGIFKYSREEGTFAANLDNHVEEHIKDERYQELMNIQEAISLKNNQALLGQKIDIIIDEYDNLENAYIGRTQWDSPEIDNRVFIEQEVEIGSYVKAEIIDAFEYDVKAIISHGI